MKLDCWLVVQGFMLPGSRERLPQIYAHLDKGRNVEAAQLIKEQVLVVEGYRNRKFDLDYLELAKFLLQHRHSLTARLETICLRLQD